MTTTTTIVLEHVRRHGRIADLDALAREAGRSAEAVLRSLKGLRERGTVHYLLWDGPVRVLGDPAVVAQDVPTTDAPSPSLDQAPENGIGAESSGPSTPRRRHQSSVGEEGTPAAPGASSRPSQEEAFLVVDRKKRRLRGFVHIEDACRSQHKDLPHGYGVVRVSDGKWMSRLMPAGWGQPKADEEQEDLDDG